MTRVLIIEDHRLVAQGLELGLRAEGFVVETTDGTPSALAAALAASRPDVVLLDLYLAEQRSGIDLIPHLLAPGRSVIVLTAATDPHLLAHALEAGADAVLDKTIPFPRLVRELRAQPPGHSPDAAARRTQVLADARRAAQERARQLAPFAALSRREEEVLRMLIDGAQAAEIAERSYVSLATVRTQIHAILTKLGVGSQLAAVSMALKAGWVIGGDQPPTRTTPAG